MYYFSEMRSPLGQLKLIASNKGLCAIYWKSKVKAKKFNDKNLIKDNSNRHLLSAKKQLQEYFSGKRKKFSMKFDLQGTEFQLKAWQSLQKITFGETWSYKQQAFAIGKPKAVRAVGRANGSNPIPIIIPCHRVVGCNGDLVGFAGGLNFKKKLLNHEQDLL